MMRFADDSRRLRRLVVALSLACAFLLAGASLAFADLVDDMDDEVVNGGNAVITEATTGADSIQDMNQFGGVATFDDVPLITIKELMDNPIKYNNTLVRVSGEAIGDILSGDTSQYKWINISADGYSLGVYVETGDADKVSYLGAHGVKGTTLTVTGTFHAACNEGHAGELDLHAKHVAVKDVGGPFEHDTMSWQYILGAVLMLALALEFYVFYLVSARRLKKAEEAEGIVPAQQARLLRTQGVREKRISRNMGRGRHDE